MTTTTEIQPGRKIDLTSEVLGLDGDGRVVVVEQVSGRPPQRIDGYTIGAPYLTDDAPHDGEMHPDGDEILFLVSGAVTLRLELSDGDRVIEIGPGETVVIPRGVWHKITLREPGQLVHITPGPGGGARPLVAPTTT